MANIEHKVDKRKNQWVIKSDVDLKKELDNLRRIRFVNGIDTKLVPYNDILHASFRYPPLINILKKAEFIDKNKENKK